MAVNAARQIFDDLLNIEVNVISAPGMTGRKMPEPHQALLDVVTHYDTFLCRSGLRIDQQWHARGRPRVRVHAIAAPPKPRQNTDAEGMLEVPLRTEPVALVVTVDTFDELGERARETEAVQRHLRQSEPRPDDSDAVILRRIFRNCDQLKAILERREVAAALDGGIGRDAPPEFTLPLTPAELITVRKVWEVGVEQILMQTVAQLDGDMVTRVDLASLAASKGLVQQLHRSALDTALTHWQFMFQTLAQLTGRAFQSFLGR